MALRGFYNGSTIKTSGAPTDEQLDKINSRLEEPLTKEEVFVFRALASNNNKDSYHSRMAPSSLKNYAEDAKEGRAFMNSHRTNERPTGRTFDAEYDSKNKELFIDTYVLRGVQLNETPTDDFIRSVKGGIVHDVSIRFSLGEEGREVCDLCKRDLADTRCAHVPGLEYEIDGKRVRCSYTIEGAHLSEVSDVYKGSTPNAGIMRKARQMFRRGLLDAKQMRVLTKTLDQRYIQGEEFLLFDFEKDGGLDDNDGPDGDQPTDPSAVNNLSKTGLPPDNLAKTNPTVGGRGINLDQDERKALIKFYSRQIEDQGELLDPDSVREINEALTKWRADEDADVPFMKKKEKKEDKTEDEPRFLAPKNKTVKFTEVIRALGNGGSEGLPLPTGGMFDPGKGHDAGMLMEGESPLANVASGMYTEVGSGEVPTDADIIKGLQELNAPALMISPSGAMFLMNGGGSVSGEAGVGVSGGGLMVPMGRSEAEPVKIANRIDHDGKDVYRYDPICIRLDDVDNIRALVHAAIDGGKFRRELSDQVVSYGTKVHGKNFDESMYRELCGAMSTNKLESFRDRFRAEAVEHFRTHKPQDMKASEFDGIDALSRQTLVKSNFSPQKKELERVTPSDPHDNPALYKS